MTTDAPTVFDLDGFSAAVVKALTDTFLQGEGSTFQNDRAGIESQSRFLIRALRSSRARRILETGTHKAHFSYLARLALPHVRVDTFGIDPDSLRCVELLNEKLGRFVTFWPGDSRRTLADFAPAEPMNFAWIDGGHDRDTCASDLQHCDRLSIAHVCVDDVRSERSVAAALDSFLRDAPYEVVDTCPDRRGIVWVRRVAPTNEASGAP